MKLKLDENVDVRVVTRLRLAGHDVATVSGQGLNADYVGIIVIRLPPRPTFAYWREAIEVL